MPGTIDGGNSMALCATSEKATGRVMVNVASMPATSSFAQGEDVTVMAVPPPLVKDWLIESPRASPTGRAS